MHVNVFDLKQNQAEVSVHFLFIHFLHIRNYALGYNSTLEFM